MATATRRLIENCDHCGDCVKVCYGGALVIFGQRMTAQEVVSEASRRCGGGVTLSGGEPTYQDHFAIDLLRTLHAHGIHTALETCGYAKASVFRSVLEHVDYLFFDIKHADPVLHRRFVGRSNRVIMENLRAAVACPIPIVVRVPLIPGVNDDKRNIKATAEVVRAFGSSVEGIELMPYHTLGLPKYQALGFEYPMEKTPPSERVQSERVQALFETLGIRCSIST